MANANSTTNLTRGQKAAATRAANKAAKEAAEAAQAAPEAPTPAPVTRGRVFTYAGQEATLALVDAMPKGMGRDQHARWGMCQEALADGPLTVAEFCAKVEGGRRTYRRAFRAGFFASYARQPHPGKADS